MIDRRPLAKAQSRDVRKTVRFTPAEVEALAEAARGEGDDFSRYVRDCTFIGHSVRRSVPTWKPAVA